MTIRSEPDSRLRVGEVQVEPVLPDGRCGTERDPATLRLRVLGARSGMPSAGEPSSGYLLQTGDTSLLFDCGPGTAGELRSALGADRLDGVFISHLHLDHCYDLLPVGKTLLAPLVSYPRDGVGGELVETPVPVLCAVPAGGSGPFRTLQGLFPVRSTPALDQVFDLAFALHEYEPSDRIRVGDCEVTAVGVRHVVPSCGFRVQSPAGSFAYTADTGWTDALVELAAGVDLLLCEATLDHPDTGPHGHLCAAEAGRLATAADVGTLVLTHYSGRFDERRDALVAAAAPHFSGRIVVAAPRTVINFRPEKGTAQT